MQMKEKVLSLVDAICNTQSTNCRSLNKANLARELMDLADISKEAEIQEIPLDWNRQVIILYLLPNDNNYYSLFAGIGCDGQYHFELSITGQLNGNIFNFYKEDVLIREIK